MRHVVMGALLNRTKRPFREGGGRELEGATQSRSSLGLPPNASAVLRSFPSKGPRLRRPKPPHGRPLPLPTPCLGTYEVG